MDISSRRQNRSVAPESYVDGSYAEEPVPTLSRKAVEVGPAPIIFFDAVTKQFSSSATPVIDDVSLEIFPGEFLFLVGASGAGKSTLLKLILAEEKPSQGRIFFDGRDIATINRKHLPYYRRNIGTVFQDFKLLPQKTAFENIAYALEVYGKPTEEIYDEVPQILEIVDLDDKANRYPRELSGGEQQRVAIARALILQPKVIIADESTGNIDPGSASEILDLLLEINGLGTTVIFATHNQSLVDKTGKRVVTLDHGQVIRDEQEGKYLLPEKRRRVAIV
ncbi:MAG: cell division ATP-binding protein FtsE [Candidatus Moraniibacteriota bacterium]